MEHREQTALYRGRKFAAKCVALAAIAGAAYGGYSAVCWGFKEVAENKIKEFYEKKAAAADEERKQLAAERGKLEPLIRSEYDKKFAALGTDYTNKLAAAQQALAQAFVDKTKGIEVQKAAHATRAAEYQALTAHVRQQYFGPLTALTEIADRSTYTGLERSLLLQTSEKLDIEQYLLEQGKFFDARLEKTRLVAVRRPQHGQLLLVALNPTNQAPIESHVYALPPVQRGQNPVQDTISAYLTNVVPASSFIFSEGKRAAWIVHNQGLSAYLEGKVVSRSDAEAMLNMYKEHAQRLLAQFTMLYSRGPYAQQAAPEVKRAP